MGREAKLNAEIRCFHELSNRGKLTTHRKKVNFAMLVVKDLKVINHLPSSFATLQSKAVVSLLKYWKHQGYKESSIHNKISVLRNICTYFGNNEFPDNKTLSIRRDKPTFCMPTENFSLSDIDNLFSRDICTLQKSFGMKSSEAIKLKYTDCYIDRVIIRKAVSYNYQDRYIPFLNDEHRRVFYSILDKYKPLTISEFLGTRKSRTQLRGSLNQLGLTDLEYFRKIFIYRSYHELSIDNDQESAFNVVMNWCGITNKHILKEIKQWLENS
tara:strand:+ start:22276 stop:23085 length:810 start_codon:yes stop_codon:yes gene_type:complete